MKLSDDALAVLKNFASINSGVVLIPGKTQKTISAEKSILVEAELDEFTDTKFGIYDLNQFLGNITTLKNPEISFQENFATLDDGEMKLSYAACSPDLIITPPDKPLVMTNPEVTFSLLNATLVKLLRLGSMNALPNITILGTNGELEAMVHDLSNDTSNVVSTALGKWDGEDFVALFKTENFKILPDDYTVEIMLGKFAKFTSKTKKIIYYIALVTK